MLVLVQPELKDLDYRKRLLSDKKTMAFNHDNGGTVDFHKKLWPMWYNLWMNHPQYYYAYIYDQEEHCYIGEVSYYFEEEYQEYVMNIIIEYCYRHRGKGKEALLLLCQKAKDKGVRFLCDDIDCQNPAIHLFKQIGFKEIWQKGHVIMLKKKL